MVKAKSKSKAKRKPAAKSRLKKRLKVTKRGRVVELKQREPATIQKTVRVPRDILIALEEEAASVKPEPITVPFAIVQILEDWNAKRKALAAKAAG